MKNGIKIISIGVCMFVLGLCINNANAAATDALSNGQIAVVDVQRVVASSNQVKSLKADREAKIKDLREFVEDAKKNVAAETDKKKSKDLEDKYNKELQQKTASIDAEYAKQLQEIDRSISAVIEKEAKAKNYTLVLSKGVVLYGGTDITESIAKVVK